MKKTGMSMMATVLIFSSAVAYSAGSDSLATSASEDGWDANAVLAAPKPGTPYNLYVPPKAVKAATKRPYQVSANARVTAPRLGVNSDLIQAPKHDLYETYCGSRSVEECALMGEKAEILGNEEKGNALLAGACARNDSRSCARLGSLEISKENGDPEKGRLFNQKACNLGLQEACALLTLGD